MNLCIHGHFYQPPREDPISDYIPAEIGAEPFNNWNEKILAECYEPNALAGNFGKISFNIGPTLFRWMWDYKPEVAQMIVDQERANFNKYGVGNGMAQSYNHTILPLASLRDKVTQVRWGIEEFVFRFDHMPEGMWLPEAGVDLETLCVLSDQGLKFVILAPWQVEAIDDSPGPYLIDLPDGRDPFVVFPYRRDLSTMVSFVPSSTENGERFVSLVRDNLAARPDRLNIIASDGELYGHHQKFRNHFLSYVLNLVESETDLHWTYPGLWLRENEVTARANLVSPSSWSCFHGVDRWARECSCTHGADWKKPQFIAMKATADWLDEVYYSAAIRLVSDPWELRNRTIKVLNGEKNVHEISEDLVFSSLSAGEVEYLEILLKAQYARQRMFTSCGWFFEEFHRIEPQNNIANAAYAVWLTEKITGMEPKANILKLFGDVYSNKTGLRGDTVFTQTLIRAKNET
jgi:alpha-amylase/alpha-mannosidase (GH57 family)